MNSNFDPYEVINRTNEIERAQMIKEKNDCYNIPEHLNKISIEVLKNVILALNEARQDFIGYKEKEYWWQMIQLLPTSYNQKRTVHLNYETLGAMYRQRKHHKLDEWHVFCDMIKTLPYSEFITMKFNGDKTNE